MADRQFQRRNSLVLPIVLITVGAMFLYANWRPAFDPWPILRTYWPLILLFVGLGKMWDATRGRQNPDGTARSPFYRRPAGAAELPHGRAARRKVRSCFARGERG